MVPVETDVMVPTQETCAADEAKVLCIIRDMTCGDTFKFNMNLPASTTGKQFIEEVAKKLGYEPGTFLLNYEQDLPTEVKVNDMMDQSLGLICSKSTSRRNNFTVMEKDGVRPVKVESKDSADSGVGLCCKDSTSVVIDNTETSSISCMPSYSYASAVIKSDTGRFS
ncbi:hypothetical protein LSAT2_000430 [Lamellibrachia satsuma]|nr:hypothetical protein LSAT2_000430 [Lamellibrachia satsuma]